jgi:mannosyl-oligosaccharide alpha-1,2-mannosidase
VWNGFKAINATCRTDSGFAAVSNVNAAGGGSKYDNEESFLFAEVMKYAYLVHAEGKLLAFSRSLKALLTMILSLDAPWQVQRGQKNQFVFNTEAHPFRVAHN